MKLSCLPVSLFQGIIDHQIPLERWFDLAQECGLDGVDISMNFLQCHSATYVKKMRALFDSKPLPVVMCTTYPDFTHPTKEQREQQGNEFLPDFHRNLLTDVI